MPTRKPTCLPLVLLLTGVLALANQVARAQGCNGCTPPPSNQQWWAPGTQITVYIDPSFQQQATFTEQTAIRGAVADWFNQSALTSNNITYVLTSPGEQDPGPGTQGVIRILNDPNGSPYNLAYTAVNVARAGGAQTTLMYNATISFNRGFMLDPDTPAYIPQNDDAEGFLIGIFHHELGHAFGEDDARTPIDGAAGLSNPCLQTPGATVMNGYCGTNDEGSGGKPGVLPTFISSCDNYVVNITISSGNQTGGAVAVHTNLVAEYLMREGCGATVYDTSGNQFDGTGTDLSWISNAINFNGSTSIVNLAPGSIVDSGTSDFSAEVWVNVAAYTPCATLVSFGDDDQLLEVSCTNQNKYHFFGSYYFDGKWESPWINASPLSLGNWTQIVLTLGTAGSNIYVNGVLDTDDSPNAGFDSGETMSFSNDFRALGNDSYGNALTGIIGEVRFYNRELTPDQIAQNWGARHSIYGL